MCEREKERKREREREREREMFVFQNASEVSFECKERLNGIQ